MSRLRLQFVDYVFISLIVVFFLLSGASFRDSNFAFTIDQARDILFIRQIANFHPVLVGPTTSINGVFLGPFWYYFNLPAFIFSKE